jgi:hypothetical protein
MALVEMVLYFTYGLFAGAFISSDYIASNNMMISE